MTYDTEGNLLRSMGQVEVGEQFRIRFARGSLRCQVVEKGFKPMDTEKWTEDLLVEESQGTIDGYKADETVSLEIGLQHLEILSKR